MAARRGFSWAAFFIGAATMLLLLIGTAAILVFSGRYPVAASAGDSPVIGWLLTSTRERAVEQSAGGLKVPTLTASDVAHGGAHYKGMCERCHGGPGTNRQEFADGMNPQPPDLAESARELSTAEIFWIEKNGLKMTGMPAFGKTDEDEELWQIAAFVKQLPKTSAQQYHSIAKASEHMGEE